MAARHAPVVMAKARTPLTLMPSDRAACGSSPAARIFKPQRVRVSSQCRKKAQAIPTKNNGLIRSADCTAGLLLQPPKLTSGSCGAIGATNRFPKKKASPLPNRIMAIPVATSFTLDC